MTGCLRPDTLSEGITFSYLFLKQNMRCLDKNGPKPLHLARYVVADSDSGNRRCRGNPIRPIGRSRRLAILST